jgi:hypothetical protein
VGTSLERMCRVKEQICPPSMVFSQGCHRRNELQISVLQPTRFHCQQSAISPPLPNAAQRLVEAKRRTVQYPSRSFQAPSHVHVDDTIRHWLKAVKFAVHHRPLQIEDDPFELLHEAKWCGPAQLSWHILYRCLDARMICRSLTQDAVKNRRVRFLFPGIPQVKHARRSAGIDSARALCELADLLPGQIDVTVPCTASRRQRGLWLHTKRLDLEGATRHEGLRVTTVLRTLISSAVDLDRCLSRNRAAVLANAATDTPIVPHVGTLNHG